MKEKRVTKSIERKLRELGRQIDESAKETKTKRIIEGFTPRYRPKKPTKFWKDAHIDDQYHLQEFMLQMPEETCQNFQIEERDSELMVSLDRD